MIAESRNTGPALGTSAQRIMSRQTFWWEFMSISEGSDRPASQATLRDLMRWFSADDAKLASAERVLEGLIECVDSPAAAMPTLLAWGERLHSLSQEPETPGHEQLFMER